MRHCEICGAMPMIDGYRCENIQDNDVCIHCCNCEDHKGESNG
jgi:hypothetical protein